MTTVPSHVTETARTSKRLAEQLARAGARNFLVANVSPLGLVPLYKDDAYTATALNLAAGEYRSELIPISTPPLPPSPLRDHDHALPPRRLWTSLPALANPRITALLMSSDSAQGQDVDPERISFGTTFTRPPPAIIRLP